MLTLTIFSNYHYLFKVSPTQILCPGLGPTPFLSVQWDLVLPYLQYGMPPKLRPPFSCSLRNISLGISMKMRKYKPSSLCNCSYHAPAKRASVHNQVIRAQSATSTEMTKFEDDFNCRSVQA